MSCGHPADVTCLACDNTIPVSRMTERQRRIANLDARMFALRVHGRTEADHAEADRLHGEWRQLVAEERAS